MIESRASASTRPSFLLQLLLRLVLWAALAGLAAILALQLFFFAVHAAHLLSYPYPLDYGEGPLLAQVDLLRGGMPIWRLYGDPDQPPYAVVNYPPVYHLAAAAISLLTRNTLLAGRQFALAAALASVAALWLLSNVQTARPEPAEGFKGSNVRTLIVLSFLVLPIVREWAVLMRVDLLGVCLGLWALVIVQRNAGRRAVLWAALPLALSLLVKPSLIAAPAAALIWLLFRDWRRAALLGGLTALLGGLVVGLMQLGSGGWFLLHVLSANTNAWESRLAYGFWHDQLVILWPLVVAAVVSALAQIARRDWRLEIGDSSANLQSPISNVFLPLYYTLFGAIVAYGVGKVGAYANYFLEFYAGLIWLAAVNFRFQISDFRFSRSSAQHLKSNIQTFVIVLLLIGAQLRYYPTWSATYLKLAGIIEGTNPPRLLVGGYGLWQDLRRERDILATLSGVNAALDHEVRATNAPIFTDVPGLAAQSGQLARLQAFEYRQLLGARLADQSGLLRDMANGRVPLVVLDYLGNWLTPEMIALITHRYAQDGSRGAYDLYRPVDPGPAVAVDRAFPEGLRLAAFHLAASPGRAAYHGGETILLTLDWTASQAPTNARAIEVVVQLNDGNGHSLLTETRPLLYGALPPSAWGQDTVEHLQPLKLPLDIPPATYQIAVTLRAAGQNLAPAQSLAALVVEAPAGRQIGEQGYYVPAPLLDAWRQLGGDDATGPGDPLMPATPFHGFTMQCFVRACLRLADGTVQRVPLGELVHLADVGLPRAPTPGEESQEGVTALNFPATDQTLLETFLNYWRDHGGEEVLGPPITPELIRGDRVVQYTRYARLERPISGGAVRLGRLGEEFLRLPGGVLYRWP